MVELVCRIQLSKEKGIAITVENNDSNITQTIVMDGTSIITTVKGDETSTITQKNDSIAIKCKTFSIDAETITCKSTKATKHTSDDTFNIESSKDMTLKSDAKLNENAEGDIKIEGKANIQITTSSSDVKINGSNVKIEGSSEASLKGSQLKLEGSTSANMTGGKVDVKSDGTLNVKADGTATFGSSGMTNIKGGTVKVN